jgi:uncharacterized protein Yka (UPF0111/DUF47 family)
VKDTIGRLERQFDSLKECCETSILSDEFERAPARIKSVGELMIGSIETIIDRAEAIGKKLK